MQTSLTRNFVKWTRQCHAAAATFRKLRCRIANPAGESQVLHRILHVLKAFCKFVIMSQRIGRAWLQGRWLTKCLTWGRSRPGTPGEGAAGTTHDAGQFCGNRGTAEAARLHVPATGSRACGVIDSFGNKKLVAHYFKAAQAAEGPRHVARPCAGRLAWSRPGMSRWVTAVRTAPSSNNLLTF